MPRGRKPKSAQVVLPGFDNSPTGVSDQVSTGYIAPVVSPIIPLVEQVRPVGAGVEVRPSQKRYYARIPFGYQGKDLDRGQIFNMVGLINDEKLIRVEYAKELNAADPVAHCGVCQAQFISDRLRTEHAKLRHAAHYETEDQWTEALERQQERAMIESPLALHNTAASLA